MSPGSRDYPRGLGGQGAILGPVRPSDISKMPGDYVLRDFERNSTISLAISSGLSSSEK